VRQEIREEILARGWHPGRQAFVQHYESTTLDAANLLIPLVGFLPPTDHRVIGTVERSLEELSTNDLVHRYRTQDTNDGLTGSEGAFILCTFWLVQNLVRIGRVEEARTLFERTLTYANHLGLFSEVVDPQTEKMLGNFPQAFTHIGLVLAAQDLLKAGTIAGSMSQHISDSPPGGAGA
jgi:GH15 family glucan-1,4-alpha-glucosidase